MIVDALVLLGENRFGPALDAAAALRLCDELGIDRMIAAPARPLDYHLGPANDRLASAAAQSDLRIAGLGRVDPSDGERAVSEAQRCLDELGLRGLFLHPLEEACPIGRAAPVVEVARAHAAPVVVATGFFAQSEPLQIADVAAAFPDVPIVMTTGGQINISGLAMTDAWLALTNQPNLHVTTNGEYRQDFIERLVTDLDPARVLFASFAPYFDARFELRRIRSARMSGSARQAVEGDNAARLFSLG
jgi:predicted TIM-barrel fold metal-dependent hydrolase